MALRTRVEKISGDLRARLVAGWDTAYQPVQAILRAAPVEELAAIYRRDVAIHGWAWTGAASESHARELCGGAFDIRPGDDELIARALARIPEDMQARCLAARRACYRAGVPEAREDDADIERWSRL